MNWIESNKELPIEKTDVLVCVKDYPLYEVGEYRVEDNCWHFDEWECGIVNTFWTYITEPK